MSKQDASIPVAPYLLRVGDKIWLGDLDYALIVEKHGVEDVRCLCDQPCDHQPQPRVRLTIEHLPGTPYARRQEMKIWGTRPVIVIPAGS